MAYKKKLIEVALPLKAINEASAREKSIRHGHPSTLHLWWARRPLAAARAVIFASIVDDPSSLPEEFPTVEAQDERRQELFNLIEKLVKWENSNNSEVLAQAKEEIRKATNGEPLSLLDPFAGGGTIPLEAQRLGLVAHAHDLNPVAVMINKAMIEIPPKFSGNAPVNPKGQTSVNDLEWKGVSGLAADVRYYGEWMKQEAFKRIGHLYPKVQLSSEMGGGEATVIAWIWARTVKCPNPACGCEMPLVRNFVVSKKAEADTFVQPVISDEKIFYQIQQGKSPAEGSVNRRGAKCINCEAAVGFPYLRDEAKRERMGSRLLAIVSEAPRGRRYVSADTAHEKLAIVSDPSNVPQTHLPDEALGFRVQSYGMTMHKKLFTSRQLTALTTFSELVKEAQQKAESDAHAAGMKNDRAPLAEGGTGSKAYGQAVGVYLAFVVDRMADYHSSICRWDVTREGLTHTFSRQAIPMVWDYAEGNPFCNSTGSFDNMLGWVVRCVDFLPANKDSVAKQADAQSDTLLRNIVVSTDPPYYDNIGYADLSDYFYVWMRQSLKDTYPEIFRTMLVPKAEELVATPFRFGGSKKKAQEFFEDGMLQTFQQLYAAAHKEIPVTIYYAFKQSETDGSSDDQQTASTGWEAMLSAIIRAGFTITGTWPISTESISRMRNQRSNALASSIVLVCRKRSPEAPNTTRRDFISDLKRGLRPSLEELQKANIAPVDLAQSAIGPGMAVYSRYAKVLEADGSSMSVRSALQLINQELDSYLSEQDGELDAESRFCVDLYSQFAFDEIKFGEADVLARARNTSVDKLAANGILFAQRGSVRLLARSDIPEKPKDSNILWLKTQQLTHALDTGGIAACAQIMASALSGSMEETKALAYRLYTIAEQKGWAREALAYNSLVIAWPEIQERVATMRRNAQNTIQAKTQASLFD